MALRTPFWQLSRRTEVAAAREAGGVVLLPTGSNEQHGEHLPVDTDIVIATAVCQRAAEIASDLPVLIAPPLWSGYSPHHMVFAGSMTLDLHTFQSVVYEICLSIWNQGFRKIMLVNGHGGNIGPLTSVAQRLTSAGHPLLWASHWDLARNEIAQILEGPRKGVGHACEYETSLMLHLQPQHVDMSKAVDFEDTEAVELRKAGISIASAFHAGDPGVHGYPSYATAEKGRRLLEVVGARLAEFVHRFYESV